MINSIRKVYAVREFFISKILGPQFIGQPFREDLLKYLTFEEKKKIDESDYALDFSVFNYGLIFYSTEFDFPEEIPDETREEMECRMLNEMNDCCPPGNNKPFLNKEINGETD